MCMCACCVCVSVCVHVRGRMRAQVLHGAPLSTSTHWNVSLYTEVPSNGPELTGKFEPLVAGGGGAGTPRG